MRLHLHRTQQYKSRKAAARLKTFAQWQCTSRAFHSILNDVEAQVSISYIHKFKSRRRQTTSTAILNPQALVPKHPSVSVSRPSPVSNAHDFILQHRLSNHVPKQRVIESDAHAGLVVESPRLRRAAVQPVPAHRLVVPAKEIQLGFRELR